MSEVSAQTLHVVNKELAATLNEARVALENFAEHPESLALMEQCSERLHQAQGVLRLVEVYGAALLAEEMEQVAHYLINTANEQKNQAEGLDALMRAMVQLPAYLERVLSGGRDLALVLLPLLNDLRAVRGSALLSEGTLLLLNLTSDRQAAPQPPTPGEQPLSLVQWARRLRPRFQLGLLGWIRGERVAANLGILAGVAEKLEQTARSQPVFQLWWVVGAVIEALREQGLQEGATLKRLLGLADREIKRLYTQGEERYSQAPALDLLNNLLYYAARATSAGVKVSAVRTSFRLGELLPLDPTIEQARENLSAPSIKLMHTVGAAIKEDLTKVKDVLDIFVRKGSTQISELAPQLELLRKIGDTLGVLGLGELRAKVQAETQNLQQLLERGAPAGEAALVQMATALINVEDTLDDQLVRLVMPTAPAEATNAAQELSAVPEDTDYRQVVRAVLRECIVNLARVKDAVTQALQKPAAAQGLDAVPQLLRGITSGLLMLGKTRAVEIVEHIARHLDAALHPAAPRSSNPFVANEYLDRLADAIVSLEYYMETIQSGRGDPWYMLDNAERCLEVLAEVAASANVAGGREGHAGTAVIKGAAAAIEAASPWHPSAAEPESTAAAVTHPVVLTPDKRQLDPEFLELFIEEAREEIESIRRQFPLWDANPADAEALVNVRRSFHTLKGSGRMVGAQLVGEYAWAVENLLNRIIDKTLTRTPGMIELLREGIRALPELVEQLASGRPPTADIQTLVERAHAYAEGREPEASRAADREDEDEEEEEEEEEADAEARAHPAPELESGAPSAQPAPVMDPDLQEIFTRETSGHLAILREYLARSATLPLPVAVPESVYRACHTLSGSSKMAQARHGSRIAEPLDHYVRKVFESGSGLSAQGLAVLEQSVQAFESATSHIHEATSYFVDHDKLIERIRRLDAELDEVLARRERKPEPLDPFSDSVGRQSRSKAPSPPPEEESAEEAEFDPEIAAIFSEEATELLEAAQQALNEWNAARGERERAVELKRALHTLKGGARMAGLAAMGDLSHELETLVSQIEEGLLPGSEAAHEVLQASLDELSRMCEAVNGRRTVAPATALLKRIHALSHPQVRAELDAEFAAAPSDAAQEVFTSEEEPADSAMSFPAAETQGERAVDFQSPTGDEAEPGAGAEAQAQTAAQTGLEAEISIDDVLAAPPSPAPPSPASPQWTEPSAAQALPAEPQRPAADPLAPIALPPGREPQFAPERQEMARVDAELLDSLLNNAGEVSIFRARLEQQVGAIDFNLVELTRTVIRLKEQLRNLEIETEAQILHRHEKEEPRRQDFDPLELDRYSAIQQFSRALAETASDVASIQGLLENLTREAQNLLLQQSRVVTELQNGLMRTRMVPFQRHVQRLTRIVRQVAAETGKRAELNVSGASGELDRQVLERIMSPFEHMLRNAVVHGIEPPAERAAKGKPEVGRITLSLRREGAEVVFVVRDDGAGINVRAVREKAVSLGLFDPARPLSDEETLQLILEPGFSTASKITQAAGRGVGMDVVANEVKKLGGALAIESTLGEGTAFTIRLPFTLAISQALIVRVHDELYALPLPTVEGVVRLPKAEILRHLEEEGSSFDYGGQKYRFQHLGAFIGSGPSALPEQEVSMAVVLVRAGEHSTALITDELVGSREIVVKSVGPQISAIRGISGATILGDGRIVLILDMGSLVRAEWRARPPVDLSGREGVDKRTFALVVDDSITVRRVTQRLLERNGMRVMTAKDGVDAIAILQDHQPDVILLDIEMPRMDGYEVAAHVRNDERLKEVPIVMITSRVGEKHRARAIELGVDDYLGKPYQEAQLLDAIEPLVAKRRSATAAS